MMKHGIQAFKSGQKVKDGLVVSYRIEGALLVMCVKLVLGLPPARLLQRGTL